MKLYHGMVMLLFSLSLLFANSSYAQNVTEYINGLDQKIPEWLDEFIVPGAAIVVIDQGEIILQKGYGFADQNKGIRVGLQTGFNIGSISKTVAAWGVLKLVEEGKIDLDVPVDQYLTRWKLPRTKFDHDGVTVRRMLSHTAGLSLHGYPGWSPKDELPSIEESLSGKNNGPGDVRVILEPGTTWKYSGGGYTICQLIIEEITGLDFSDYMQKEILEPLGMSNSSYDITEEILLASSEEHNAFGEEISFELFTAEAAAGLHTTIVDFTTFAMASLGLPGDHEQQILSNETLVEMTKPAPASEGSYGLGYSVDQINDDVILVGHGGANSGWHAYLRLNRETGDGFAMMTNGGSGYNVYRQAYCDWIQWKYNTDLGDRCKKPITTLLIKTMMEDGIEAGLTAYKKAINENPDDYFYGENMINSLGYEFLYGGHEEKALALFQLNVDEHPDSWNVYDSLAEGYMVQGETTLAIEYYEKSIKMNPENKNGIDMLKKIRKQKQ